MINNNNNHIYIQYTIYNIQYTIYILYNVIRILLYTYRHCQVRDFYLNLFLCSVVGIDLS